MRPLACWRVVWPGVLLGLVLGCEAASQRPSAGKGAGVVDTAGLPALGDYLPPLDNDRIAMAPPQGWYVPPASSEYVVRVQKSPKSKYPSVIVTAEDYQREGVLNVSGENVREFAGQMAVVLEKDKSAVRPVEIGKFVGVAHAKRGIVRKPVRKDIEMLCLETVVGGRKYCVELRSEQGSLQQDQPYLYAIVDGLRFPKAASAEKPAEPPGEKIKEAPKDDEEPKAEVKEKSKDDEEPKAEAKEEPKAPPQEKPEEQPEKEAKEKPKKDEIELDLDKLDELLKKPPGRSRGKAA